MQLEDVVIKSFRSARVFKVGIESLFFLEKNCNHRSIFSFSFLPLQDNSDRINSLDFHRTQDLLVTAGDDDAIHVYNTERATEQKMLLSGKYGAANISFTHDPNSVLYSSNKGGDHAWRYHDLNSNKYLRYFRGHTGRVTTLCMSPKSDVVLSAAEDKQVRLWDLRTPFCQALLHAPGLPTAAFDEQGLVFCIGSESGVVKLYDARQYSRGPFTAFTVAEEQNSASLFRYIRFSLDGKYLLGVVEGRIYLLNAFTGDVVRRVTNSSSGSDVAAEGGMALEACLSPDSAYIISGCTDRSISVWSVATGDVVARWEGHAGIPACLKWSPRKLLVASACQALSLWIPDTSLLK